DHLQARGMVTRALAALTASPLVGWARGQWVPLGYKSQLGATSAERGVKSSLKLLDGARFFLMLPYITLLVSLSRAPGAPGRGERKGVSNAAGGQWRIQQDVGLRNLYIQI